VARNARTMMLHVALRWPGFAEQELWPMAMSHAVHLWNHTPKMGSGLAPIVVFTGSKSDYTHLLKRASVGMSGRLFFHAAEK
jgi:hypothetical protein